MELGATLTVIWSCILLQYLQAAAVCFSELARMRLAPRLALGSSCFARWPAKALPPLCRVSCIEACFVQLLTGSAHKLASDEADTCAGGWSWL